MDRPIINTVNNFPYIIRLISALLFFVAALGFLYIANNFIKFQAIDSCNKVSKIQKTLDNGTTTITIPDPNLYNQCLQRIGLK